MRDAKVELVISAQDHASRTLAQVSREMEGLRGATQNASSSTNQLGSSLMSVGSRLGGIAAVVGTVTAAVAGMTAAFKGAIVQIENFEQTTISIAAQLTSMAEAGQGSYKEMFQQNQQYAKAFYDKLREYDAERASSIEEMMTVYNSLVNQGYQVRLQEARALSLITDLIKQKTAGQAFEIQAMQEIRGLMDGMANANSRLASELRERIGPAWRDILRDHERAGTLLEYIASLYPGIEASSAAMQHTLEAQTTTLKSQLAYIGREGLQGAYDDIVMLLARINDYLKVHADTIAPAIRRAWEGIRETIRSVSDIISIIDTTIRRLISWRIEIGIKPVDDATARLLDVIISGPKNLLLTAAEPLKWAREKYEAAKAQTGLLEGYGPEPTPQQRAALGLPPLEPTRQKIKDVLQEAIAEATAEGMTVGAKRGQTGLYAAITEIAKRQGVGEYAGLLRKMLEIESGGRHYAAPGVVIRSPKGAIGAGQLMPETARALGVDPYNLEQNLTGMVKYYKQLLQELGDPLKAAAAYNAGPARVRQWFGEGAFDITRIPIKETRAYMAQLTGLSGLAGYREYEQELERARREQEKLDREAIQLTQHRLRISMTYAKESQTAAEHTAKEAEKIDRRLFENKLKLAEDYQNWYLESLRTILHSDEISAADRLKVAQLYYSESIKQAESEAEKIRALYPEAPEDVIQKVKEVKLLEVNRDIAAATNPAVVQWEAAWKRAAENIQDAMADMIYALIAQTKTAGDALRNLVSGMLRMMSQMAAQALMSLARYGLEAMGRAAGLTGGLGGVLGFAGKIFGFGGGSASVLASSGYPAIDAAIGGLSYKRFAEGGISTRPMLAWVSEKGPEAHIPLRDGAVPVQLHGQRNGDIQIINVFDQSAIQSLALQALQSDVGRRIVINTVNAELLSRGSTMRVLRGR